MVQTVIGNCAESLEKCLSMCDNTIKCNSALQILAFSGIEFVWTRRPVFIRGVPAPFV